MARILGIETSCDETAIGIVEDGRTIRSNVVASSQEFHTPYGGVIPEIAARVHVEVIWPVLEEALSRAGCGLRDLDAIAVTQGPGLPGALLIGVAFAKGLALATGLPLIGVDHLAAHLYAGRMVEPSLTEPFIGLVVSGGHSLLCVAQPEQRFELLGETRDDAVGEAFDKVARLLGLGYPGGPVIDRLSDEGDPAGVAFPRQHGREFDFSFSGLKTAVYVHLQKALAERLPEGQSSGRDVAEAVADWMDRRTVATIAASFQAAAVDVLVNKTLKACQRTGLRDIVIGGGVAANRRLRARLTQEASARQLRVVCPPLALCVDNGAMVAGLAEERLRRGQCSPLSMNADPHMHLNN